MISIFHARPRAFSAVSSSNSQRYREKRDREAKMLEVSSPDLGVDLITESDMYSSLERGNTFKGKHESKNKGWLSTL